MKKVILTLVLFGFSLVVFSQDYENEVKAFKESYTLEYKGDYTGAISKIKEIYRDNSYEQNLRLGWLNYMAGNFNESISFYSNALKLMPYSEEAKFGIIYPYSALGKWSVVEEYYKKILETSPNNTTALYKLGMIYYGRADYLTAYKYFKKVVDLYPFSHDGLLMYAWTNFKLKKYREAKILFYKVLMLNPNDSSAKEGLGYLK
jgi:tetratricopeptide (TPR) repeat protein